MQNATSDQRDETFANMRQRMIDETSRFIEYGLAHPELMEWIPAQKVSQTTRFSDRIKRAFWSAFFRNT